MIWLVEAIWSPFLNNSYFMALIEPSNGSFCLFLLYLPLDWVAAGDDSRRNRHIDFTGTPLRLRSLFVVCWILVGVVVGWWLICFWLILEISFAVESLFAGKEQLLLCLQFFLLALRPLLAQIWSPRLAATFRGISHYLLLPKRHRHRRRFQLYPTTARRR